MGKLLAFRAVTHRARSNEPRRRVASAPRPCDFCSAPRPAWRHQSLDFAACEACHLLIEAGNRTGLAERTYATAPVPPDLKAAPGSREALMTMIVELHGQFFERAALAPPVLMLRPIQLHPSATSSPRRGVGSTTAVDPSRSREPELLGDVPPHPKVVERMCALCDRPFLRGQPRREPARADGRYVHADPQVCARLERITVRRRI